MKIFQPGEKYELIFSAYPRAGSVAGSVEILSVDRVPDSEMDFKSTSVRGCFDACVGTIKYIVYSDTTNTKPKTARLIRSRVSEEWAKQFCGGVTEYEWFSPTKRSYYPISSRDKQI